MSTATHTSELFDQAWLSLVHPPDLRDDPRVRAAKAFKDDAEAKPEAEYGWAYDYAREQYDRKMAVRDSHDAKAGEIIKYLGGGAGLFTLAALMNLRPENRFLLLWAIPSFLATLASLLCAVLARKPNETALPPTAETAKEYADHFKSEREAKAAFIGQWHYACEAITVANGRIARKVELSIWLFLAAVALLIAPVLAALLG